MNNLLKNFLKYVDIWTTSDPHSMTSPSSDNEIDLIKLLEEQMKELGLKNVYRSKYAYVYGTIPANTSNKPSIGFIAHVDTASEMSGKNIKPQIFDHYDGKDVKLNNDITMSVNEYSFLKKLKNRTLITTDGTTLLGADDKAGIAEIMEMATYLMNNKEVKHGEIHIAFTPDEEIGQGTDHFELDKFPCQYAYTVDGGAEGEINFENFNAASAKITFSGKNIHPGTAKNHMVNSMAIALEFHSMLDKNAVPEKTEKYEGFNHLIEINGNVEKTVSEYIIRNHDKKLFLDQKQDFKNIAHIINKKYPASCKLELNDSYFNMHDLIKDKPEIVDIAVEATKKAQVIPNIKPIRGGTDGAMLTFKGLPTPNLGTGGYNFHGKYECISLEGMEKVVDILLNIVSLAK